MGKKKIERKYDQLMKIMIPKEVTLFNHRTVRTAEYHADEVMDDDVKDACVYGYDVLEHNHTHTIIDCVVSLFTRNKLTARMSHLQIPSNRVSARIYYDLGEYNAKELIQKIIAENYKHPASIVFTNEFKTISSLIEDTGIYNRHYLNTRSILINSDIQINEIFETFKTIVTIHIIDTLCWLLVNTAIRYVQKTHPNFPINILIIDRMMRDKESVSYLYDAINQLVDKKGFEGFPIDLRGMINEVNMTIGSHINDLVYYKDGSIETGIMIIYVREINEYGVAEYAYKYELTNMQKGIMSDTLKDSIIKHGKEMAVLTHYSNYIDRVLQSTISALIE